MEVSESCEIASSLQRLFCLWLTDLLTDLFNSDICYNNDRVCYSNNTVTCFLSNAALLNVFIVFAFWLIAFMLLPFRNKDFFRGVM